MIVIVCIDDNGGMMFNNRRQSRDAKLTEKIIKITKGSKLWLDKYSMELFDNADSTQINMDDAFLSEATIGEFCFVENADLSPYEKWIEKLIVFRWNRSYPYDRVLDIDLSKWRLADSTEFEGNSHEKITMEVFVK